MRLSMCRLLSGEEDEEVVKSENGIELVIVKQEKQENDYEEEVEGELIFIS